MTEAVSLSKITKNYGAIKAVDKLDLMVEQGEIVCLLGTNGAGKSTTINILLGLTTPDGGTPLILGSQPQSAEARQSIGVVRQDCDFPRNLTAREVISLVRAHYPDPRNEDELIENFDLTGIVDRQTGGFSGGQRRRLALALAFAGNAPVLVLDEPTTGLDSGARQNFWNYVATFQKSGGTLLVTTHHLSEIETLVDRICLINQGRIEIEGPVDEIRKRVGQKRLCFRCNELPDLSPRLHFSSVGDQHALTSSDADLVVRQLVQSGVDFHDLEITSASLEDAIKQLTRGNGDSKH